MLFRSYALEDYKIVEELKTWEVSCELNNDSTIYANLPKHICFKNQKSSDIRIKILVFTVPST